MLAEMGSTAAEAEAEGGSMAGDVGEEQRGEEVEEGRHGGATGALGPGRSSAGAVPGVLGDACCGDCGAALLPVLRGVGSVGSAAAGAAAAASHGVCGGGGGGGGGGDDGGGDAVDSHVRRGVRRQRTLTEEELRCLRLVVPLLSKACGMDARASWLLARSSLTAAAARGLLREARRPLATLNTFGSMLVPRLKEGEPDKDMAEGILMQGKRLQDLLWQLEDALHGPPTHGSAAMPASMPLPASGALPAAGVRSPLPPAPPAPPFSAPSARPCDPSPAVQELLQLPQPQTPTAATAAALASASPHAEPAAHPDAGHTVATSATEAADRGPLVMAAAPNEDSDAAAQSHGSSAVPEPVLPGRVTFVDRSSPASGTDAYPLRQPPAQGASQPVVLSQGCRPYTPLPPAPASTTTIDVEMDERGSSTRSTAAPAAWDWSSPQHQQQQQQQAPHHHYHYRQQQHSPAGAAAGPGGPLGSALSTNLVAALQGVLTAACKLAAVSGIGFSVNPPLMAIMPRRSSVGSASSKQPRPQAATDAGVATPAQLSMQLPEDHASAEHAGPAPGQGLIPRPVRPLLVGVRGVLLQRVVGYVVDIALQCTPRGGQVCVSARPEGAGVQVQVQHSGRMEPRRLQGRAGHRNGAAAPAGATTHVSLAAAAGTTTAVAGASAAAAGGVTKTRDGLLGHGSSSVVAAPGGGVGRVGGRGSGGGLQVGSGALSVEMAQELARQAGGRLTVLFPTNLVNAASGGVDVGTSVEIWLPGPSAASG
ncbi:hypothetical protein Agub_g4876 [Astrephomene gubernaculifera]|uniref:Uncharacterized protein n=1 Tax=Astrephomene gubernaculifera TaxID=47775 RepID=A0AAD3DMA5_9CHLO|nr:hypothetical protein Agub_g4876 [Astrephomene gubernaculifera]